MIQVETSAAEAATPRSQRRLVVLIPVYDDWAAAARLLPRLDGCLAGIGWGAGVVLVDDRSNEAPGAEWNAVSLTAIEDVRVLTLRRNMGHQRAIAMGLAYIEAHDAADAVVVMDGDGEDDPADVPRLLRRYEASGGATVVFAERTRRIESLPFRAGYACYRAAHRLLTGIPVKVGNFSVLPRQHLRGLVVVSELWNHYAAAVFHARLPRETVPTSRAPRLAGRSKMDMVGLVVHGMSALSVHIELIGVRLLIAAGVTGVALLAATAALAWMAFGTGRAAGGWVLAGGVALVVMLAQWVGLLSVLALMVLRDRASLTFVPARDYGYFVEGVRVLAGSPR